MANSINTNVAAYFAQANISVASNNAAASVSRLSSGNRIVKSSDDVAALSIGTSLQTGVSALKVALTNASQGTSLLQVADGGLSQITSILQRQKAIALQAGSGSLTNSDRSFLDIEFQQLSAQIDSITNSTTFNSVKLLNGSLSTTATVADKATQASAGTLNIAFGDTIAATETVSINGVTLTASATAPSNALTFLVGATTADTVANLASRLNAISTDNSLVDGSNITAAQKLALSEVSYSAVGSTLVLTSRTGGAISNSFRVGTSGVTTSATTNGEAALNGSYAGTSFNLFTDASAVSEGITSTGYVINSSGASAGAPFKDGDALKVTIGGTQKTLFTFTAGGGSGASGAYTLQDLTNGINANASTTGVKADVIYNGANYNIRLSTNSLNGVAILDAGTNFNSTTLKLNGDNIDTSSASATYLSNATATGSQSVISTDGYRKIFTTDFTTGNVATQAATVSAAVGSTAAGTPLGVGNVIQATVNGNNYVLHTVAASDGLDDIVGDINSKTAQTGIFAVVTGPNGGALNIRLYASDASGGGAASGIALSAGTGNDASAAVTAGTVLAGTTTGVRSSVYGLSGGADNGIGIGSTSLTSASTAGDGIITDISQTKANSSIILTSNATAGKKITFNGKDFYFTSNTTAAPDEILIGSSITDTIDNAVKTLNRFAADGHAFGNEAYVFNQVNISRDGNSLVIEGKKLDNVLTTTGGTVGVSTDVTGATATASTLSNASSTFGVKANGINNSAFTGKISGFKATYTGTTDQATLSVKVGDFTYSAQKVDLTQTANTTIRFLSDTVDGNNGGYFDVQLKANQVNSFSTQADADAIAQRLDTAFSSIGFIQSHAISSYAGSGTITTNGVVTGSLNGTKVSAQLANFSNLNLSDVNILAPSGSNLDAKVTFVIGGTTYSTASGIGSKLAANQTYKLTSAEDPNQFISFAVGNTAIDLGSDAKALAAQSALKTAFGAVGGASSLKFQIGETSADSLSVSLGSTKTADLFHGASLSVATQSDAEVASTAIDDALSQITGLRAQVGALQSRFNYASANIQTSVQNQDAARGSLLDTDIATESTAYATSQVKLQAGISVLAQANQQLQALLKLIG